MNFILYVIKDLFVWGPERKGKDGRGEIRVKSKHYTVTLRLDIIGEKGIHRGNLPCDTASPIMPQFGSI